MKYFSTFTGIGGFELGRHRRPARMRGLQRDRQVRRANLSKTLLKFLNSEIERKKEMRKEVNDIHDDEGRTKMHNRGFNKALDEDIDYYQKLIEELK